MNTLDKTKMKNILKEFADELFDRYYIVNPPTVKQSNRLSRGYGRNKNKETESLNYTFITTQPSEQDIDSQIAVFVEKLKV